MESTRPKPVFSQLWQVPLLIVALGAFGYSVYRFADPGPGPTLEDKLKLARDYLKYERPEAAIATLNEILKDDLPPADKEAESRFMLAESLEVGQRLRRVSLPENHEAIVEQTRLARLAGGTPTGADLRRLGESLEALAKPKDAIAAYREAWGVDANLAPALGRRVIELQLSAAERDEAEAGLNEYLSLKLADDERAWALGESAELLIRRGQHVEARARLGEVLKLSVDDQTRGLTAFRDGWCALELGEDAEAERQLRLARQLLKVRSPVDADAALLLGRIFEKQGKPDEAMSFYGDVILSHPDSRALIPARAGRGVSRILKADDEAGLSDLTWVAQQLQRADHRSRHGKVVLASYERAEAELTRRANYQGALEVLGLEKALLDDPPAAFWGRVASVYEKRADQVDQAAKRAESADERQQLQAAARQLRVKAGDASFSYALSLTLLDDKRYGQALWRSMELYDRAGAVQSVVAALELFTLERPSDPEAPEATLRLGKAYMAAGQFDKAISAFQRNQFRYPSSWAAIQSAVPLSQALIAKGSAGFPRAERVLLDVVENNRALTPQAAEFRDALFELAQLYYRQGRYEESIARFDEAAKRYPEDERMGQVLFLMADGYRKSALLLGRQATDGVGAAAGRGAVLAGDRTATSTPASGRAPAALSMSAAELSEADSARRQRLSQAKQLFDRVVTYHRDRPPLREIDRSQQRLAHFYRADCSFDLGLYEEAIKLYDQAAFRYQDDASALAAYVQIVNANVALGRQAEARSANERAKWLLKRMPPQAFSDGSFALSRAYWEQWLKWSGETGLWPGGDRAAGGGGAVGGANSAGAATGNAP